MSKMSKKDEFLSKAKEAEGLAERTKDDAAKASWLRIAAAYHDLASNQDGPKP